MNDVLNDLAPVKNMRVHDKDVPYMTPEWKSAIRAKLKANAKYLKKKTPETGYLLLELICQSDYFMVKLR